MQQSNDFSYLITSEVDYIIYKKAKLLELLENITDRAQKIGGELANYLGTVYSFKLRNFRNYNLVFDCKDRNKCLMSDASFRSVVDKIKLFNVEYSKIMEVGIDNFVEWYIDAIQSKVDRELEKENVSVDDKCDAIIKYVRELDGYGFQKKKLMMTLFSYSTKEKWEEIEHIDDIKSKFLDCYRGGNWL